MARETKVGLLAGLAFIICFAIILANGGGHELDNLTLPGFGERGASAQEQRATPPAGGARRVPEQSSNMGHQAARRLQPRWLMPRSMRPGQPEDQAIYQEDSRYVRAADGQTPVVSLDRGASAADNQQGSVTPESQPRAMLSAAADGNSRAPDHATVEQIQQLQNRVDELTQQLQGQDPWRLRHTPQRARRQNVTQQPPKPSHEAAPDAQANGTSRLASSLRGQSSSGTHEVTRYTVVPGDTLTKIAHAHYGSKSGRYIKAIYDANATVLENPNVLRVGVELVIPPIPHQARSRTAEPDRQVERGPSPADKRPPNATPEDKRDPSFRWYQIKKNDRYVSIARDELGDEHRWREIYEMNKDKFPDPGLIREGVRIKLPLTKLADSREARR